MDRQVLSGHSRPLQQLDGRQLNAAQLIRPETVLDGVGKGGEHQFDRGLGSKENSAPADAVATGKAEYMKDRQPGRSILRKQDGPGLQALQSKFSSLQDDVMNFNAQKPARRESFGRGGIPAPLQPVIQQVAAAPQAAMQRPDAAGHRPPPTGPQAHVPPLPQQRATAVPYDTGSCQDDDVGLGAALSKERLIKLPAGLLANTKVARAAADTFEEPAFAQQCTDGLTKQLQRTKDGATDKSRIHELAELVKLLRKCVKEMGSRASTYIEQCATVEREYAQTVENITLASKSSVRQVEAELASARSALAAAERDFRNEKAQLGLELDTQKAEVSRLMREMERLSEERDCAREDAARTEQQRQQLDLELKELRRAASQQQREISVSQSEAVRLLTEEKNASEIKLASLKEEYNKQATTLKSLQECLAAYEQENRMLHLANENLSGSLSSKDSVAALQQEQTTKLKKEIGAAREQLALLTAETQRLQAEVERSNRERATLEAFVEEQAKEVDNQRSLAKSLESALAQDRGAWEDMRQQLEASLSALSHERSQLAKEIADVRAQLGTACAQKDEAESSAAHLAVEKSALMRDCTNLRHQLEFADGRTAHFEQEAAALRSQMEAIQAELETNRRLLGEKDERLEQLEGEFAALKEVLGESTTTEGETGKEIVTKLLSKIASLQHAAVAAEAVRRQLHNELVDLRGNIRVYCRVKPHATPATRLGTDGASIAVAVEGREHNFTYDRVFGPDSTQAEVFGAVSDLVQSALDGFHVCVFSYGQTGAGKTHTMQGGDSPDSRGIIPRALEKILAVARKLENEAEWSYTMEASFIEVYNQNLRDLLSKGNPIEDNNAIKHDPSGGHTTVAGAKVVEIKDMEGAAKLVRQAHQARAVVATAMNAASSRSHCVFMLNITGRHASTNTRLQGSLCLVDLAGSERLDRSLAEGAAQKEACAINSSLSALGDVFAALAEKKPHVPHRNSKLTYLLKPCLGGNGKTLMFVNINPEPASAGESLCSLRFAAKVNSCETGAKGGARRNIQTVGGGGGGSGEEQSGSGDPAGEARRRGTTGGASGINAAAVSVVPIAPAGRSAPAPRQQSIPKPPQARNRTTITRPVVVGRSAASESGSGINTAPAAAAASRPSGRHSLGIPRLAAADTTTGTKRMSLASRPVSARPTLGAATRPAPAAIGGLKRPGPPITEGLQKKSKS